MRRDGGKQLSLTIEPIKPFVGGIVHVDKAHLCDDETVEACRAALEDQHAAIMGAERLGAPLWAAPEPIGVF